MKYAFEKLTELTRIALIIILAVVLSLNITSCSKDDDPAVQNDEEPTVNDVTDGLTAKFTFDNGDIKDEIGSLSGTNVNGEFGTSTFNGEGKALKMSGLNDDQIAFIQDELVDQSTDFSISTWFNLNSINSNTNMYLVTSRHALAGGELGGVAIAVDNFGALYVAGRKLSPFEDLAIIKYPSLNTNQWYHLVVKAEGSTLAMWVDGVNVATGQIAGYSDGKRITSSNTWAFGAIYNPCACVGETGQINRELDGSIDDVRFYNRALTEDEIKTLSDQRN